MTSPFGPICPAADRQHHQVAGAEDPLQRMRIVAGRL
jgi:hypothetical protein